jgi:hypothetical protein
MAYTKKKTTRTKALIAKRKKQKKIDRILQIFDSFAAY